MTYTVVIKGSPDEAKRAARRHGFLLYSTHYLTQYDQTSGHVVGEGSIHQWYAEPPTGAPFPAGALLHFQYTAKEDPK